MKTFQLRAALLIAVIAGVLGLFTNSARAQFGPPTDTKKVVYNPNNLQAVQGEAPFTYRYDLTVKSPSGLPGGPAAITMMATAVVTPAGVSPAVAASYMTFVEPGTNTPITSMTFNGPNQTRTVSVLLSIPAGSETGDFTYLIRSPGWPSGIVDEGTYVNTHVNPPSDLVPPAVSILTPVDGASYTHVVGQPPVDVPIAVLGEATENAPVLGLVATITGENEEGEIFLPETSLAIALTGLGTPLADGIVTLPVSTPGVYTIRAVATNVIGSSITTSQFTVEEEVPPPTVVIDPPKNNPSYTYVRGVSSVTVPYTFVATSLKGGIQTLTATLDGDPITPASVSGIGQLVATGSGSFTFDANTVNGVGQHTLVVRATDAYGEASTSATFVVIEKVPEIAVNIGSPMDGAVFTLPPDASPLHIPFDFTATVTLGGTVKEIAATLTNQAGTSSTVSVTGATGLNTPIATGSGTLSNVQPGVYTLRATGANVALDLEASDSVTFMVMPPPPPAIVFTQTPQANYTTLTGHAVSIPFAIRTTSTGAYISSQRVTLDGQPVAFASTANGTALTATGSGTLTIPAPAETTTYTLIATGVDAYGQEVSTITTFTVTVSQPAITIAINPQIAANSPYTLPTGGAVTIPFIFTGSITSGATVDTIVGELDGQAVTIASTSGLGTSATATASGNLTITAPGTYVLMAKDTNTLSGLSATTSVTFVVEASDEETRLEGVLFFDVDLDGIRDAGEHGLAGITVRLLANDGSTAATTISDADGAYTFSPSPGEYVVSAGTSRGFSYTTAADHAVTATGSADVPDTGYGLHFASIRGLMADGFTIGYWKNNLSKALDGKKNGIQVSAATLGAYTAIIGNLALEPFDGLTMQRAVDTMEAKGSNPATLLAKQLMASEFNYANGAFIGGNETLTYAFVVHAEHVLKYPGSYSSGYVLFMKDWCDAYNNSHGGAIQGPLP